ncbi:MAG: ornithine carbamoyltransferase [Sandaracinaceae bacterium]
MSVRHFKTLRDLDRAELDALVRRAIELAALRGTPAHPRPLDGKTVVVLLEKASTRTRVSFEVGIHELGGLPLTLLAKDTQLGRGEPIEDTARMLSGYAHAVVYRTHAHERIEAFAAASRIPLINGLSDAYHPCQLLADLATIRARLGRVEGLTAAWIGDGNNMAHSYINAAVLAGFALRLACPEGYDPDPAIVEAARRDGARIDVLRSPREAVRGADVVTTDVWASMGQEEEAAARMRAFASYQVDAALMAEASSEAIFLHCLPAHRGEEVSAEVLEGPRSAVWQQAEYRLHAQKALLELLVRTE